MALRVPLPASRYAAPMSRAPRPDRSLASARAAAALGLLGQLGLTGLGCRAPDGGLPHTERAGWRTHVVYEGKSPLYGIAAGDIDLAAPGDELVAVGAEGEIVYIARNGPGVRAERIGDWGVDAAVELVQVAIGDVDRALPGAEIVMVGAHVTQRIDQQVDTRGETSSGAQGGAAAGSAFLLVRDGAGFTRTELHRAAAPLRAVLVADLDPAFAGNEVALAGDGREVVLLVRTAEGLQPRTIADLPGAARAMAATETGLVVACDDGSLVWLARTQEPSEPGRPGEPGASGSDGATWRAAHTWRAPGPLTAVVARGADVLVCGDDGVLRMFQLAGVGLDIAFVRETRCLRLDGAMLGVACSDSDVDQVGFEVASVAEDGTVHVVRLTPWPVAEDLVPASAGLENHRVRAELVAADDGPLRALAACRLLPFEPRATAASGSVQGDSAAAGAMVGGLACAGASGRVLVVLHSSAAVGAERAP